ncbi:urease accessory protein UreD [Saccharospirillum mangrovi]|uniref:urease accessory protein UreD n=1 Tax=Saccharospirillum mangrovi TaxID=2161747 RepID=UPI000D351B5F|nr:urease accessory protein UreD [Saccharospirillum mangrovi]
MNSRVEIPAEAITSRWDASLSLGFETGPRGTRLMRCRHQGPLYVQKAFYPEGPDCAHAYLLHPPGGLVSGDDLRIHVEVGEKAHALLTTPGAGRAYRARSDGALQHQRNQLTVAAGGMLEWLPQENILYPNAHARLDTEVDLAEAAHFIGWEITSLGWPASGRDLEDGAVQQRLQIRRNNRLVLREQFLLHAHNRTDIKGAAGLRQNAVNGVLIAGPFAHEDAALIEQLHAECQSGLLAGVSQVGDFIVLRALANRAEPLRELFIRCWALLRPALINVAACPPRVWKT